MSKNEMITMIETMNNYDDLAAKAKAKARPMQERTMIFLSFISCRRWKPVPFRPPECAASPSAGE